jgi:hypothetical protein
MTFARAHARLRRLPACCRWPWVLILALLVPGRIGALTVAPPEFDQLVNQSEFIVRTVVKSVHSEWRVSHGQKHIFTFVELEVRETIAGTPPQPLVLRLLGGRIDGEVMEVEGGPEFRPGQEDVLFVRGNGVQFIPLTAVTHGRYPILRDAATGKEFVARSNHSPLHSVQEVAAPMTEGPDAGRAPATSAALSPEEFIRQIRTSAKAHAATSRLK